MTIIIPNESPSSIIESLNPKTLSKTDLEKIVEIEQDMWGREDGLGEYVKCTCCDKIHSKEDIFGHISKEIRIQTIKKIEELIDFDIVCPDCKGQVKAIYDRNEYIESVIDRYQNTIESFLTVYRDNTGEIRGFIDGYIDSFEMIFKKELEIYYGIEFKNRLIDMILENISSYNLPDKMLSWSSVGMEKKYTNFYVLYDLIKSFFYSINELNLIGIAESAIGTNTHRIYHSMGAISIGTKKLNLNNRNTKYNSDLFIHPGIVSTYRNNFIGDVKSFLRENKIKMNEILKVA